MSREKEYIFLSLMVPQEMANEVKRNSSNNMADTQSGSIILWIPKAYMIRYLMRLVVLNT